MSLTGKNTLSLRKKDVQEQKSIAVGFKKLVFAHKATLADTGINLNSLVAPAAEMPAHVNPSLSDLQAANLLFYKDNLTLVSSFRGLLIKDLAYRMTTNTNIQFIDFTAEDGEIFVGIIDGSAKTGQNIVDARPIVSTGLLTVGNTDYNVGTPFRVNEYPLTQSGEVIVFRNGVQQFRNVGNSPSGEGNYYEVNAGGGLGVIIRFNNAAAGDDDSILVISNGLIAERPDGSMMAAIENIAGQMDQVIPTVAALAGVPETDFQVAPNNVDLKAFGDRVLDHEERIEDLEEVVVLMASTINAFTSADGTLVYPSVEEDTLGGYNFSTGEYTVQESGVYRVEAGVRLQGAAQTVGFANTLAFQVNTVTRRILDVFRTQTASSIIRELNGSGLIRLTAGQVVRIRLISDFAASTDTATVPAAYNYFTLTKIRD